MYKIKYAANKLSKSNFRLYKTFFFTKYFVNTNMYITI